MKYFNFMWFYIECVVGEGGGYLVCVIDNGEIKEVFEKCVWMIMDFIV